MDLVQATLRSDNTVYAQLDIDLGPKNVRETAEMMGITTPARRHPGRGPRRPAPRASRRSRWRTRTRRSRRTASATSRSRSRRSSSPTARPTSSASRSASACSPSGSRTRRRRSSSRTCTGGTGTAAQIGCDAAGKTGTTDNFNDAWFVGYTPHLAASVWVGYPNALVEMRSVHGISVAGGTFPAQIWQSFMTVAKGTDCDSFRPSVDSPEFTPVLRPVRLDRHELRHELQRPTSYTAPAPTGPGDNSAGGEDYSGYDPRLYESPPQEAPETPAPAPAPSRTAAASARRAMGRATRTGTTGSAASDRAASRGAARPLPPLRRARGRFRPRTARTWSSRRRADRPTGCSGRSAWRAATGPTGRSAGRSSTAGSGSRSRSGR